MSGWDRDRGACPKAEACGGTPVGYVKADAALFSAGAAIQACVGPGVATVQQVKNFQNNGSLSVVQP